MNRPLVVAASLLTLCAVAPSLHGQGVQTGTLRGAITDPQDRTVSGATITISSGALQGQRTGTSDPDGNFVFTALPPGVYRVEFTMPSFASVERTVTIPLGGTIELRVPLRLAGVVEQVQVAGDLPAVRATASIGLNITHGEVEALATSRTLPGIASLSPGVE